MSTLNHHQELAGWTQIAKYLGVSTPTARRYYRELGLPVDDRNGRYFADPSKLDEWRRRRLTSFDGPGKVEEARRARDSVRSWPSPSTLAAGVGVVLVLAVVVLLLGVPSDLSTTAPERVAVEGTVLVAFDAEGREAWRVDVQNHVPHGLDSVRGAPLLEDFDRDGRDEVAVTVIARASKAHSARLLALDDDGQLLWSFLGGGELTVRGRRFDPVYGGDPPRWLETHRGSWILYVAAHSIWYPVQITLLEPTTGEIALEYWHPGRVYSHVVTDLVGDGSPELYLGGINNPDHGVGHPALAVLPLPAPGTELPTRDTFIANDNPRAIDYVLFPTYDVFEVQALGAGVHLVESPNQGELLVGIGVHNNALVYLTLDSDLEPVEIRLSDGFLQEHARLYRQGLLDHPFDPVELESWSRALRFDHLPDGNSSRVRELSQTGAPAP